MKKNAEYFLKKTLGNDFLESFGSSLSKSEVYKQGTRTITDTDDLFQGLQIVPRTLLSLLVRELSPMQIGDNKEITIPLKEHTIIQVTKHERDSFSGQVLQNNVKIADFLHRSIPGLGLVLMTVLELYDMDNSEALTAPDDNAKITRLIDDRMHLHSLINQVIDGKLMHRDAVQQMIMSKLNQMMAEHKILSTEIAKEKKKSADIATIRQVSEDTTPNPNEYHRGMTNGIEVANCIANEKEPEFLEAPKKKRPLNDFVENRKKKLAKKEFAIEMTKSESINCPDCNQIIFNGSGISSCICYGTDMGRKVFLKKTENGIKVSFPKSWSPENIEMLLEVLRKKRILEAK